MIPKHGKYHTIPSSLQTNKFIIVSV